MTILEIEAPEILDDAVPASSDDGDRALFYEYSTAADPIRPSLTPRIPYHFFPPSLYADGPSRILPLDISAELKTEGPATGPGLCANFIRIVQGDTVQAAPLATSMVFYVLKGAGRAFQGATELAFGEGDFFTLPGTQGFALTASEDAALYYVNDAPLLRYLGVAPSAARFEPTIYKAARANEELAKAAADPGAALRSRISVLLGNTAFPLTRTVTHVLWAMYGMIGPDTMQKPHRHQSIALDLIVDCAPGCYTLVGRDLDENGDIRNPVKVDWEPGCAFITPPGYWHAHFNSSDRPARLIPIQDAGLQTYLRSLDIRFA
ncbi:cupin domain-containing protein [Sphingomonas sp. AP4-R1]|uniref:cupin domain-containing protein n=1 Tax=Sphingomonas sp. AP4-R1 TaxID=2735134 RepID=UPI001493A099|nr:cupin domain-containing protein [Sphingomonas sp. AP4-R1]QJU59172.1 cupin domain-containing protein [Sphingomonas sp. AP4-R1]